MGNVIGISFATTVVAARMAADGYTASLADSGAIVDDAVNDAFMQGFRLAFVLLVGLTLAVLLPMGIGAWRGHAGRGSGPPIRPR
jgi:hypothetical protein